MLGFLRKKDTKPTKLVFGDHNSSSMVEVLGYDGKSVHKLEIAMQKYFIKNDGEGRRTQQLERFIKSREFSEVSFRLETPNDYFILGQVFSATMRKLAELHMIAEDMMRHMASAPGSMFGGLALPRKPKAKSDLPN